MSDDNKIDDGGPAFPHDAIYQNAGGFADPHEGMSLRAWLAGTIAAGYRASENDGLTPRETALELAELAIQDADALIEQLKSSTRGQQDAG